MLELKSTIFKSEKLVRSKTVERCKSRGITPDYKILNEKDYLEELFNKLKEETNEVCSANTKKELEEEIADVLEVLDAIIIENKLSKQSIEKYKKDKKIERGDFSERLYITKLKVPNNLSDYKNFLSQPEKYPIIDNCDLLSKTV